MAEMVARQACTGRQIIQEGHRRQLVVVAALEVVGTEVMRPVRRAELAVHQMAETVLVEALDPMVIPPAAAVVAQNWEVRQARIRAALAAAAKFI